MKQHVVYSRYMSETQTTLKFFYNGIKGSDKKLQRCFYSAGELRNFPTGTIAIYGRGYESFSAEVRAAFTVENNSDGMTDYFENDHIRVMPNHPLYAAVKTAMELRAAKYDAKYRKVAA